MKRTLLALAVAASFMAGCDRNSSVDLAQDAKDSSPATEQTDQVAEVTGTETLPLCDDGLKSTFRPDELTTVVAVKAISKGADLVMPGQPTTPFTQKAANDLCMVKLMVGPGTPGPADAPATSSGIGIEVFLPTADQWNGRIHNIGGHGGYDGGLQGSPDVIDWPYAAAIAGTEGAVSASTDSGHVSTTTDWALLPDGTPNRQGWIDFAHRAQHEVAEKTKALVKFYYGKPHTYAYYEGASTGGRHGHSLVQRYPDDYDGVIGVLPTIYFSNWANYNAWKSLVIQRDLAGVPLTEGQQDLVSNAAIHACDLVGGVHLGYVMDNRACTYDPTKDRSVLCKADGGDSDSPDCVTTAQAAVINKLWYGITADGSVPDPAVDNGVDVALGDKHRWYGMARGTSLYLAYFTKLNKQMMALLGNDKKKDAASASGGSANAAAGGDWLAIALENPELAGPAFRNASGNGKGLWTNLSYADFNRAFDRGNELDATFAGVSTANPDISAFKASGGKFLSWHGWNDESIPVQHSMRYYDEVVKTLGGVANVQDFFKLYLVPGGGHTSPHGTANPDANPPAFKGGQMYQLLVDWVEKGIEPPTRVELESPKEEPVKITQPVCAYPSKAVYGSGDPRVTTSYSCS